jgi:hypothetical protein
MEIKIYRYLPAAKSIMQNEEADNIFTMQEREEEMWGANLGTVKMTRRSVGCTDM